MSISLNDQMNKEWFIFKGTHHTGPYSVSELRTFFVNGEITMQSLLWKEGTEKWEALSRIDVLRPVHQLSESSTPDIPPLPTPTKKVLPKLTPAPLPAPPIDADEPPPIPLDALLNPAGDKELFKAAPPAYKKYISKILFGFMLLVFASVIAWFTLNEQSSQVQIKIPGVMPIYVEKLQELASQRLPGISLGMALSIDKSKLYAAINQSGEILSTIKLISVPKRILGSSDIELQVRGVIKDHLGSFERMSMIKGERLIPGEYEIQFSGKKIHYLNSQFKFLRAMNVFNNLNTNYTYKTVALIYPGTPRDFELKLSEFKKAVLNEALKPFGDKLERHQTFLSLLNKIMEMYLLTLEKISKPLEINAFEKMLIKEVSPIIQSLIIEASERSNEVVTDDLGSYKNQVYIGKQIGELASDMITLTQKSPKLAFADKTALKAKFETRYKFVKSQLDTVIQEIQTKIEVLSK
ncbi:MAG: DUF4339 domain-containing protein [Bacteriovoracaceae bacterium]|nr:DUF4339 domain-containing protein [Bacteriovoracaceae bacterium]